MKQSLNSQHWTSCSIQPTVLVFNNEDCMRLSLRKSLEHVGCRVIEVFERKSIQEEFVQLRPDLVVLDLSMPGIEGFQMCAALRSIEEGRHVPIMAVADMNDAAALHKAFQVGVTDFISRPVDSELLGCRALYFIQAGRALREIGRSEANLCLLRTAVESLPIGITISDANGKIIYTNPAEAAMHGFEVPELFNQEARILAPHQLHRTSLPKKIELWRRESVNQRKNGEEFHVHLSSVSVQNSEGKFLGIVTACEDITERKQNEQKIQKLAYYDSLTGLPNRALFLDRLQKALAQADRSNQPLAVLFLDLDNFKDINDTRGHEFGDRLLKEVARRLSGCIRAADSLARLGGDEFVVILPNDQDVASTTARRILEEFRTPFEVDGRLTYVSFSIGIALYPEDASDQEALLRSADTAMYEAKANGRQTYKFFSPDMNDEVMEKVVLESGLRQALEQEDLTLVFQPQWDLESGSRWAVEALARWKHPDLGDISPEKFIPIAENSGQIFRLGEWVLRSACNQAKKWAEEGYPVERVAVNISGHQLRQTEFPEIVKHILSETKLDSAVLELEFTENILLDHTEVILSTLRTLKQLGVQLSIDDFGTGYSSLSYLKSFQVDRIKIDRTFIDGINSNAGDSAIVNAIIALARTLRIKVLAEGVERKEQLEILRNLGCSEAQGFLLGNPMPAEELIQWFLHKKDFEKLKE